MLRIAHAADLHLGRRQYYRENEFGVNQREADVALTFRRFIDAAVAAECDLVLVAGDVFHSVRPPNAAVVELYTQLANYRAARPNGRVVLLAGNHDTPLSIETGSLFPLFSQIERTFAAWRAVGKLSLPGNSLTVTCVPHRSVGREKFAPDPATRWNILLIHGAAPGCWQPSEAGGYAVEELERRVQLAQILEHVGGWDYVAVGDYHVRRQLAPNAFYSGSLDFVSTDPWSEIREAEAAGLPSAKGWNLIELRDDAPPTVTFQPIAASRRFVDLPVLDADGDPARVNEFLKQLQPADVEGKVLRQVVLNLTRLGRHTLDEARVRLLKARALHFNLDIRPPAKREPQPIAGVAERCLTCGVPYVDNEGNCSYCGACGMCGGKRQLIDGVGCLRCGDDEPAAAEHGSGLGIAGELEQPSQSYVAEAIRHVLQHQGEDPYHIGGSNE